MITSGKKSTDGNEAVTLLEVKRPMNGVLSVWTFDSESGAGTLRINGGEIEVDAGAFSFQTAMYPGGLIVQIQRTGETDMTNWQAVFAPRDGT